MIVMGIHSSCHYQILVSPTVLTVIVLGVTTPVFLMSAWEPWHRGHTEHTNFLLLFLHFSGKKKKSIHFSFSKQRQRVKSMSRRQPVKGKGRMHTVRQHTRSVEDWGHTGKELKKSANSREEKSFSHLERDTSISLWHLISLQLHCWGQQNLFSFTFPCKLHLCIRLNINKTKGRDFP